MIPTTSTLTWLDHSESDQRRMREVLKMFEDRGTVDDLGIGTVRDTISNALFPGTSIIQTRARYFLFIPWLFKEAERRSPDRLIERAGNSERKLIEALKASGDHDGLIGVEAGVQLRTLPSTIYWGGLASYGIFLFPGMTKSRYGQEARRSASDIEFEGELSERSRSFWNRDIPDPPNDFPGKASFDLTRDEADWLCNRLLEGDPVGAEPSLLAAWVNDLRRGGSAPQGEYFWAAELPDGTDHLADLIHHAAMFSQAEHGAALLYNLLVAERRAADGVEESSPATSAEFYESRLHDWAGETDPNVFTRWAQDTETFWLTLPMGAARVPIETRNFITGWMNEIAAHGADAWKSESARELIKQREMNHKLGQSRFNNRTRRISWVGESGLVKLGYRWSQVKRMLDDLHAGLNAEEV